MVGQAQLYCHTCQEEMQVQIFTQSYIRETGPSNTKNANDRESYHISSYEEISWESQTAPLQVAARRNLVSTEDAEWRHESSTERSRKRAPSKCTDMLVASQENPQP